MTVVRTWGVIVSALSWLSDSSCNYFVPSRIQRTWLRLASVLCCLLLSRVPALPQTVVGEVPIGTFGNSVAINSITNKIYVANERDDDVTEIDGANQKTRTIPLHVGSTPMGLAINPITNKIYVACQFGNSGAGEIAVIDANNFNAVSFTSLSPFPNPFAIAVDPVKNLVFVLNQEFGSTVSVFDGNMLLKQTIILGTPSSLISAPAIAVDSLHSKVYVTGAIQSNGVGVSIIDENNLTNTNLLNVGLAGPGPIVVDEVTNKVLVLGFGQSASGLNFPEVLVIDTANCQTSNPELPNCPSTGIPLTAGAPFGSVVLNPATHKAYAGSGPGVTVIDTSQPNYPNSTIPLPTSTFVTGVVLNSLTNKIYASTEGATSGGSGALFVIDGTTDTLLAGSTAIPSTATIEGLNPITNRIYGTDSVNKQAVIIDAAAQSIVGVTDLSAGNPRDVAVNPATHKVYMANEGGTVTVFNPLVQSNNITSIRDANAVAPVAVAVDSLTNMIYVANFTTGNVTVINGQTDTYETTITDPNARGSFAIAVSPSTNKVYVANNQSNNVTIIDAVTNTVIKTVSGITAPFAIVADDFTSSCRPGAIVHKVYVTNNTQAGVVTEIDGNSDTVTATIPVGSSPAGIALNPCPFNQLWVANENDNDVTFIDAEFHDTVPVTLAGAVSPRSVAVDALTNQIYVANFASSNVSIIDGNTPGFPSNPVPVGTGPVRLTINPSTGHVYVANFDGSSVSVIDGPSQFVTTLKDPNGFAPDSVAVDPTTSQIFVANFDGSSGANDSMTVLSEETVQPVPLQTSITPLPNNLTTNLNPTFDFLGSSSFNPPPPIDNLFYQFDTWQGAWTSATKGTGNAFTASPTLAPGFHILYAFATDSLELSSGITLVTQTISPFTGNIAAYPFVAGGTSPFPQIASISPTSGIIGTQITIHGSNFGSSQGSSTVTIGAANAETAISWGDSQIVIDVPFGADIFSTSAPVIVTVNGVASNSVIFTVIHEADLAIAGSAAPNPVNTGSNLTYSFTVQNLGPNFAQAIVFTDVLPATVTFVSANVSSIGASCLQVSGTVTCSNIQLAPIIETAAIIIVVTPNAAGLLSNTATVTSELTDPNPANNTATVTSTVNTAPTITVTVTTSPSGPNFTVDGANFSGTQTFNWSVGSMHSIGTTSPQTDSSGNIYNFSSWSDGGTIAHSVTASAATTYTATFNVALTVTSQLSEVNSGLPYSRVTQTFVGTVTLTNMSAIAISGPIQVLFTNLTPGVTLANATGTYQGSPFITLSGGLAPGQSVNIPVQFRDPSFAKINFTVIAYSGVL